MSTYLTTEYLRQQEYIDSAAEETYLQRCCDSAEAHTQRVIQTELSTYEDDDGNIPADLLHAMVVYAADLYANRESIAFGTPHRVPHTYEDLVQPFIVYS